MALRSSLSATPAAARGFARNSMRFNSTTTPAALAGVSTRIFNATEQRRSLPADTYAALKQAQTTGAPLSKEHANVVAKTVQKWAMARGAVAFSHWFTPVRGGSGEKYDSFVTLDFKTMDLAVDFSGGQMFRGETDGSSFPNGGLRATHSAAAYTAWDTQSPPFVREGTLYIPSAFVSHTGAALDEKTPLLRSQEAVNKQAVRLLRSIGDKDTKRVICNVGWEQEFFVVDADRYRARPDLVHTNRTLIGALPHKHQQTEAHYFGRMPARVRDFLQEARQELWALGVSISTLHNEVAPGQHETCPVFSMTNVAADQNTLTMDVMTEVAQKHNLAILFHEKPFARVNGSGKHNNWGLNTDTGANLFVPGKTSFEQARFITFVAALSRAVSVHGDTLRVGVATAGNDHRLGAQEAPPAIMSLYTGANLGAHLENIVKGGALEGYGIAATRNINLGSPAVQEIGAPVEDRNRTAPFPFCGNRFEFRAVGGSQNIAFPLAILNTIVADSLGNLAAQIEGGKSQRDAVASTLKENMRAVFNGNGYSEEWRDEAKRRGLPNLRNTVEAYATFDSDKNKKLFAAHNIFTAEELHARTEVLYENYVKTLKIEASTLLDMMNTGLIPAVLKDSSKSSSPAFAKYLSNKQGLYDNLATETDKLKAIFEAFPDSADLPAQAAYAGNQVKEAMVRVRNVADQVERVLPHDLYPFPKYSDLFYGHHSEANC